jgi:phospholipid/cholesterol/gamma-HCH transport system permease protein
MPTQTSETRTAARLRTDRDPNGRVRLTLSGDWSLNGILPDMQEIERRLAGYACERGLVWDLRDVDTLDETAALLLLHAWRWRRPSPLALTPEQAALLSTLEQTPVRPARRPYLRPTESLVLLGRAVFALGGHALAIVTLLGQLFLDTLRLVRHPSMIPWRELSASIHRTGGEALPITALVGFLVGVVLSYLSAIELRYYGADTYIVNVAGIGVIRELGPLLAAILVAGRSGSAITAQLGVMRVTQELDVLSVMGISHTLRLVLPKIIALAITLPLLIVWTDAIALIGGALAAERELGISFRQFMHALPGVVPIANVWIGLGKGVLFGAVVALIACHYGLRVKPNTESLGSGTTASVVTAITLVILIDAIVAVLFSEVGFY